MHKIVLDADDIKKICIKYVQLEKDVKIDSCKFRERRHFLSFLLLMHHIKELLRFDNMAVGFLLLQAIV